MFFPFISLCKCVSVSTISFWVDFIPITQCLWPPLVHKIVILMHQQGKKSRDPWWDEFIKSVGQQGQLIMLLSRRQEGGGRREQRRCGVRARLGGRGSREKAKVNKRTWRKGGREGGQEVQKGISPWFKRSCAHTERALLGLCRKGGRWPSGGLCIRACGCVSLCAVCKGRSAIFNIPVSLDLEYQNNLSGSIQMLLPLHTFLPHLSSFTSTARFSYLAHMVHHSNSYSSDKTDICFQWGFNFELKNLFWCGLIGE